jgi:hypothetical protein
LYLELHHTGSVTDSIPDTSSARRPEEVLQAFQGVVLAFLVTGEREPGRRAVMRILENQEKVRSRA